MGKLHRGSPIKCIRALLSRRTTCLLTTVLIKMSLFGRAVSVARAYHSVYIQRVLHDAFQMRTKRKWTFLSNLQARWGACPRVYLENLSGHGQTDNFRIHCIAIPLQTNTQLSRCVARRQSSKPRESSCMQRWGRVRLQAKKIFKKNYEIFFFKNFFQGQQKNKFGRGHSPTIPLQLLKVSGILGQAWHTTHGYPPF